MKRSTVRNMVIALGIIAVIGCITFWKWPRPLLSHFQASAPDSGSILLMRGREGDRELNFDEEEQLRPLWSAIEHTRIRHLGGYSVITLEDSLYKVGLRSGKDGHVSGWLFFDCDDQGNIYIGQTKYEIVGSLELVSVLQQYFDVPT